MKKYAAAGEDSSNQLLWYNFERASDNGCATNAIQGSQLCSLSGDPNHNLTLRKWFDRKLGPLQIWS